MRVEADEDRCAFHCTSCNLEKAHATQPTNRDQGSVLNAGGSFIYFGAVGPTSLTIHRDFAEPGTPPDGPQTGSQFGDWVAAGDTDNDNRQDLIVTALSASFTIGPTTYTTAGELFIFHPGPLGSPTLVIRDDPPETGAELGFSPTAGKLTNDDKDDVAVGSWLRDVGGNVDAGRVLVLIFR